MLSQNLSYNVLASAAIDQEGTMRAYEVSEEKKRKRTTQGSTGGSPSSAPLKWSRDRCHPRDQLDEVAQGNT
jgi:hypothetical protein